MKRDPGPDRSTDDATDAEGDKLPIPASESTPWLHDQQSAIPLPDLEATHARQLRRQPRAAALFFLPLCATTPEEFPLRNSGLFVRSMEWLAATSGATEFTPTLPVVNITHQVG